jgi:hypothetical protein
MKYFLTLALCVTSLFAHPQTNDLADGEIKGTVTDQRGHPVIAATVYAVPQGLAIDSITARSVQTDRNGKFDFQGGLEFGEYKLYSRKDKEGYPDPFDSFYADSVAEAAKVNVTEFNPSAIINVRLGEKAAVIEGRVIDADSNTPVEARITFMDGDGNAHSINSDLVNGKYRALLPPGKDIRLMVRVKSVHSYRLRVPISHLYLEPGQEVFLDLPVAKQ